MNYEIKYNAYIYTIHAFVEQENRFLLDHSSSTNWDHLKYNQYAQK